MIYIYIHNDMIKIIMMTCVYVYMFAFWMVWPSLHVSHCSALSRQRFARVWVTETMREAAGYTNTNSTHYYDY